jgi:glycosyltransferase involved in cell wall biosynthesis
MEEGFMQKELDLNSTVPDIVLFMKYAFHKSTLEPVFKELCKKETKCSLMSKRHLVYDLFESTKIKYPIFVIADEWVSLFRDCSEIVIAINHSPAGKNTTISSRNKDADYIFCQSQYYKNEFIKRGVIPHREIIVTGNPAASKLFRRELSPDFFLPKNTGKINVLFAPTYNRDLNIMDVLIEENKSSNLFKRLRDFSINWKSHPVLPKKYPEHIDFIRNLTKENFNISYHEDSHDDITDDILWSDLVIGDCSGALLLAAAGGKPVIAFDNPNRRRSEYFDEEGPEWKFRDDYAYRISSSEIKDLPELISKFSSETEDYKKEKRDSLVNLLFDYQKNAEEIVAQSICEILQ